MIGGNMSNKRTFRITLRGYGGEVVVGKTTAEFVEYWQDRDSSELLNHILCLDWGNPEDDEDFDPNSPPMLDDGNTTWSWHEFDDYEHQSSCYSDSYFFVEEVQLRDDITTNEYGGYQDADGNYVSSYRAYDVVQEAGETQTINDRAYLYSREAYMTTAEHGTVPAITILSSEKGSFGEVYIETDGEDLNLDLLTIHTVETDLGEFLDGMYYDGNEVEIDYDGCDTTGKYMDARVGWFNEDWHDKHPDEEGIREYIEDWKFNYLEE
jgi:hypothetical protein